MKLTKELLEGFSKEDKILMIKILTGQLTIEELEE